MGVRLSLRVFLSLSLSLPPVDETNEEKPFS